MFIKIIIRVSRRFSIATIILNTSENVKMVKYTDDYVSKIDYYSVYLTDLILLAKRGFCSSTNNILLSLKQKRNMILL